MYYIKCEYLQRSKVNEICKLKEWLCLNLNIILLLYHTPSKPVEQALFFTSYIITNTMRICYINFSAIRHRYVLFQEANR